MFRKKKKPEIMTNKMREEKYGNPVFHIRISKPNGRRTPANTAHNFMGPEYYKQVGATGYKRATWTSTAVVNPQRDSRPSSQFMHISPKGSGGQRGRDDDR